MAVAAGLSPAAGDGFGHRAAARAPAGSPTGRIAFSDREWPSNGGDNWEVLVVDPAAPGKERNITRDDRNDDAAPQFSPDGRLIAFFRGDGVVVIPSAGGKARLVAPGVYSQASWSPAGRALAYSHRGWLRTIDLATRRERRIVRSNGYAASWSPDGTMLVFDRTGRGGAIWRVNANGRGLRRLTKNTLDTSPTWSPNGRQIAFTRIGARGQAIWLVRPDGAYERHLRDRGVATSWSPDGRYIAYADDGPPSAGGGVWVIQADGTGGRRVATAEQIAGVSWGRSS